MIAGQSILGRTAKLTIRLAGVAILLLCLPALSRPREPNAKYLPELKAGQEIVYEIHGRVQRHVKTQSRVASILGPGDAKQEFSGQLRVKIKQVSAENGRPVMAARAVFEYPSNGKIAAPAEQSHPIEFTISRDGQVKNATGLDDLDPVESIAWQFWLSQFAFGWTLPPNNLRRGEKWKHEEPESSQAPIARLIWERETTYGEKSNCPVIPAETCAVFYTSARLKQKSSAKDSTPEDYRLHDLKTAGTATGTNEIYTTISQNTGLAMRGSEDVKQSMNVVIVKADESNGVRYTIDATSHFEMLLVVEGASPTR